MNRKGTHWRRGQSKLSTLTFPSLKSYVIGEKVAGFRYEKCGDVYLSFENGATMEFLVDATKTFEHEEAHRVIVVAKDSNLDNAEHFILEK